MADRPDEGGIDARVGDVLEEIQLLRVREVIAEAARKFARVEGRDALSVGLLSELDVLLPGAAGAS